MEVRWPDPWKYDVIADGPSSDTALNVYREVRDVSFRLDLKFYCPHLPRPKSAQGSPPSIADAGVFVAYAGETDFRTSFIIFQADQSRVPLTIIRNHGSQVEIPLIPYDPDFGVLTLGDPTGLPLQAQLRRGLVHIFGRRNLDMAASLEQWPEPIYMDGRQLWDTAFTKERSIGPGGLPRTLQEWIAWGQNKGRKRHKNGGR